MRSRRAMLGLVAVAGCAAGVVWWYRAQDRWPDPGSTISAAEAHAAVGDGRLALVDIRTPEEWQETGVPQGAHRISMHQDTKAFIARVRAVAAAAPGRPVALICQSGYRSALMRAELERSGLAGVLNVAEGVAGGRYGAGWIRGGLPLQAVRPLPAQ